MSSAKNYLSDLELGLSGEKAKGGWRGELPVFMEKKRVRAGKINVACRGVERIYMALEVSL